MTTKGYTLAVDELVVPVDAGKPSTPEPVRSKRWHWIAVLSAGFVLQFAWRLYLSWPLYGPTAHADEDGYLLAARVVGGGANAMLPAWSIMRPIGYPLILSPIHWFVEQPAAVYKGVHIVNAIIMAAIFPLIYVLARRLFDVAKGPAAAIAFVVGTLPSAVFFGEFALTDALLPTVVLLLLLAVHGMFASTGRKAAYYGVMAGVIVGYAANTHVRGLVMMVVLGAFVLLGLLRKWLSWLTAIGTAAAAAIVYVGGLLANDWLERRMFENGSFAVEGRILGRLTSFNGAVGVTLDALGQIWHLTTSTWGLAGFGLAAAVFALIRKEGPLATRITLGAAFVITFGIAAATATGIPYETEKRVNNHIYGRYVAILAAFWVMVGVVALIRASTRRAVALAASAAVFIVVTIVTAAAYWGDWMKKGGYVNFDSPELSFLMQDWKRLSYYKVTLVVAVLIGVFALVLPQWPKVAAFGASRWKNRGGMALLGAATLVVVMFYNMAAMVGITHNISDVWEDIDYASGVPNLVRDVGVHPGDSIIQANSVSWQMSLRQQHEVYWETLRQFDPLKGAPPGHPEWVVASAGSGKVTDWYGWDFGYHEVTRYKDASGGDCIVWKID